MTYITIERKVPATSVLIGETLFPVRLCGSGCARYTVLDLNKELLFIGIESYCRIS